MTLDLTLATWFSTLLPGTAVVIAGAVAVLLLARSHGSAAANRMLGGFLLAAACCVLYVLLIGVQPSGENLGIILAPLPYTLALGPLLYGYVRARLGAGLPHPLHAALPLVQAAVLLAVGLAPDDVQVWWMSEVFIPWYGPVQIGLAIVSLAGYLVASWRAVRSYPVEPYAWARRRDAWLRRLLTGVSMALLVLVLVDGLDALSGSVGVGRPSWLLAVERTAYGAFLLASVGAGLVQAGVRLDTSDAAPARDAESTGPPRGGRERPRPSSVSPPTPEALRQREALDRLMEAERPYLDPNLSLGSLADQLGLTDKALSALFNDTMGTTYTAYVNGHRVAEAERRLVSPEFEHLSVLAIGLDAGFASKSTFNRVFKETTGQTPSEYRTVAHASAASRS
ncbi:MAG: helix-turn-helix transcriptional regulator [Bacteroidota bacterium]